MPPRTEVHTVEPRDKTCGVTRRACGNSEPAFAFYEGVVSAQVIAHFFTEEDALDYAKWRNKGTPPTK